MNLRFVAITAVLLFLACSRHAHAVVEKNSPSQIRLGVYLVELEDFDARNHSFTAEFYLWAISPLGYNKWIQSLGFPNTIMVESSQVFEKETNGTLWSSVHVSGEFRAQWDLHNHPFDRRELVIVVEESFFDSTQLVFQVDQENSLGAEALLPAGWHITNFEVTPTSKKYSTAFGDPSKPPKSASECARLEIKIEISRDSHAIFWKLTTIPYISTIMVFLSFFLKSGSPRFSVMIGSLFATSFSLRGLNSELGSTDIFTLMDAIHLATLVYVILGIFCALASRELFKQGVPEFKINKWNIIFGIVSMGAFIALNLALVWNAMNS